MKFVYEVDNNFELTKRKMLPSLYLVNTHYIINDIPVVLIYKKYSRK